MGMYGVEEGFWVGDDRFEVNASSDYAVGHGSRDIWVAHRKTLADLARTSFTGSQLLGAYDGPDQNMRKQAFAQRLETLRTSYKEARRAPQTNSTRLTRHEKKDVTRLERTLVQELCTLDRSHFDLNRVYAQVQHAEDNHFLRSFYETSRLHGQMRSQSVPSNTQVRQDLLIVAGEVRARWLR